VGLLIIVSASMFADIGSSGTARPETAIRLRHPLGYSVDDPSTRPREAAWEAQ
jgi:hypothetical protein